MSKLIGKPVECDRYPGHVGKVEDYDPETGYMTLRYFAGAVVTVHISTCKVVRIITEREYQNLKAEAEI